MALVGKYTRMVLDAKVVALKDLVQMIQDTDFVEREQFTDLITALLHHMTGIKRRDIAQEFDYSDATVSRWVSDGATPHKSVWPYFIEWSVMTLNEKIVETEQLLKSDT